MPRIIHTATGSINPDYTVGLVGGLPHKVEAAVKADTTRLLIPMGQQMDLDENLGQWVDVMEVGRAAGGETVEVGDVFEAYESITGLRLPEPRVVVNEPRLSDAAQRCPRRGRPAAGPSGPFLHSGAGTATAFGRPSP